MYTFPSVHIKWLQEGELFEWILSLCFTRQLTNKSKNLELHDALEFILDGADSEISDFSSGEDDDVIETGLHQDMECEKGDIGAEEWKSDLID